MSVEFSSAVLSDLQVSLGGSPSYIVVSDFERLANEVAQLRLVANKIASALANPTWVAGDELCRRAATALEHGWYAECEQDSEASIRAYPYRAAPHLLKALAQWHLGKAVDAFECLRACMRYGRIAEADHAATACLLAVNLAAMSGSPAMVRSLLAEGIECTRGRCPQLFVAAVQQGACERDETRACQLLLDDPSAWLKLDVSADLFGLRGSTISSLHKTLVAEIETLMLEAEGIYQKVDLIPAEYFPPNGHLDNFGIIGGREKYMLGLSMRLLRPLWDSVRNIPDGCVAWQLCAGHALIRLMSHKPADGETAEDVVRSLSSAERKDLQLVPPLCSNDAAFHELVGEEFVPDLFLEDYYRAGIYRRTRGVRREYDMWYRDRVRKWINYFDSDSPPGPVRGWGSRRRTLEIRQDIYRRQHVARPYFEQFLNCAPPDTSRLCNVIKSWMTETVATDEAVVKPFATIGIPDFSG